MVRLTVVNGLKKMELALHKKCPNTEDFLVRIQEKTDQKKFQIWTLFTYCGGGINGLKSSIAADATSCRSSSHIDKLGTANTVVGGGWLDPFLVS